MYGKSTNFPINNDELFVISFVARVYAYKNIKKVIKAYNMGINFEFKKAIKRPNITKICLCYILGSLKWSQLCKSTVPM